MSDQALDKLAATTTVLSDVLALMRNHESSQLILPPLTRKTLDPPATVLVTALLRLMLRSIFILHYAAVHPIVRHAKRLDAFILSLPLPIVWEPPSDAETATFLATDFVSSNPVLLNLYIKLKEDTRMYREPTRMSLTLPAGEIRSATRPRVIYVLYIAPHRLREMPWFILALYNVEIRFLFPSASHGDYDYAFAHSLAVLSISSALPTSVQDMFAFSKDQAGTVSNFTLSKRIADTFKTPFVGTTQSAAREFVALLMFRVLSSDARNKPANMREVVQFSDAGWQDLGHDDAGNGVPHAVYLKCLTLGKQTVDFGFVPSVYYGWRTHIVLAAKGVRTSTRVWTNQNQVTRELSYCENAAAIGACEIEALDAIMKVYERYGFIPSASELERHSPVTHRRGSLGSISPRSPREVGSFAGMLTDVGHSSLVRRRVSATKRRPSLSGSLLPPS